MAQNGAYGSLLFIGYREINHGSLVTDSTSELQQDYTIRLSYSRRGEEAWYSFVLSLPLLRGTIVNRNLWYTYKPIYLTIFTITGGHS